MWKNVRFVWAFVLFEFCLEVPSEAKIVDKSKLILRSDQTDRDFDNKTDNTIQHRRIINIQKTRKGPVKDNKTNDTKDGGLRRNNIKDYTNEEILTFLSGFLKTYDIKTYPILTEISSTLNNKLKSKNVLRENDSTSIRYIEDSDKTETIVKFDNDYLNDVVNGIQSEICIEDAKLLVLNENSADSVNATKVGSEKIERKHILDEVMKKSSQQNSMPGVFDFKTQMSLLENRLHGLKRFTDVNNTSDTAHENPETVFDIDGKAMTRSGSLVKTPHRNTSFYLKNAKSYIGSNHLLGKIGIEYSKNPDNKTAIKNNDGNVLRAGYYDAEIIRPSLYTPETYFITNRQITNNKWIKTTKDIQFALFDFNVQSTKHEDKEYTPYVRSDDTTNPAHPSSPGKVVLILRASSIFTDSYPPDFLEQGVTRPVGYKYLPRSTNKRNESITDVPILNISDFDVVEMTEDTQSPNVANGGSTREYNSNFTVTFAAAIEVMKLKHFPAFIALVLRRFGLLSDEAKASVLSAYKDAYEKTKVIFPDEFTYFGEPLTHALEDFVKFIQNKTWANEKAQDILYKLLRHSLDDDATTILDTMDSLYDNKEKTKMVLVTEEFYHFPNLSERFSNPRELLFFAMEEIFIWPMQRLWLIKRQDRIRLIHLWNKYLKNTTTFGYFELKTPGKNNSEEKMARNNRRKFIEVTKYKYSEADDDETINLPMWQEANHADVRKEKQTTRKPKLKHDKKSQRKSFDKEIKHLKQKHPKVFQKYISVQNKKKLNTRTSHHKHHHKKADEKTHKRRRKHKKHHKKHSGHKKHRIKVYSYEDTTKHKLQGHHKRYKELYDDMDMSYDKYIDDVPYKKPRYFTKRTKKTTFYFKPIIGRTQQTLHPNSYDLPPRIIIPNVGTPRIMTPIPSYLTPKMIIPRYASPAVRKRPKYVTKNVKKDEAFDDYYDSVPEETDSDEFESDQDRRVTKGIIEEERARLDRDSDFNNDKTNAEKRSARNKMKWLRYDELKRKNTKKHVKRVRNSDDLSLDQNETNNEYGFTDKIKSKRIVPVTYRYEDMHKKNMYHHKYREKISSSDEYEKQQPIRDQEYKTNDDAMRVQIGNGILRSDVVDKDENLVPYSSMENTSPFFIEATDVDNEDEIDTRLKKSKQVLEDLYKHTERPMISDNEGHKLLQKVKDYLRTTKAAPGKPVDLLKGNHLLKQLQNYLKSQHLANKSKKIHNKLFQHVTHGVFRDTIEKKSFLDDNSFPDNYRQQMHPIDVKNNDAINPKKHKHKLYKDMPINDKMWTLTRIAPHTAAMHEYTDASLDLEAAIDNYKSKKKPRDVNTESEGRIDPKSPSDYNGFHNYYPVREFAYNSRSYSTKHTFTQYFKSRDTSAEIKNHDIKKDKKHGRSLKSDNDEIGINSKVKGIPKTLSKLEKKVDKTKDEIRKVYAIYNKYITGIQPHYKDKYTENNREETEDLKRDDLRRAGHKTTKRFSDKVTKTNEINTQSKPKTTEADLKIDKKTDEPTDTNMKLQNNRRLKNENTGIQTVNSDLDKPTEVNTDNSVRGKGIGDISSYSDEESKLKVHLRDALIHGNNTFSNYEKTQPAIARATFKKVITTSSDEEAILKKNIFQSLRAKPQRQTI